MIKIILINKFLYKRNNNIIDNNEVYQKLVKIKQDNEDQDTKSDEVIVSKLDNTIKTQAKNALFNYHIDSYDRHERHILT